MLTNITINRSYSIGSTSQLRSISSTWEFIFPVVDIQRMSSTPFHDCYVVVKYVVFMLLLLQICSWSKVLACVVWMLAKLWSCFVAWEILGTAWYDGRCHDVWSSSQPSLLCRATSRNATGSGLHGISASEIACQLLWFALAECCLWQLQGRCCYQFASVWVVVGALHALT